MAAYSLVLTAIIRDDEYLAYNNEEGHFRLTCDATGFEDAKAKFAEALASLPGITSASSEV